MRSFIACFECTAHSGQADIQVAIRILQLQQELHHGPLNDKDTSPVVVSSNHGHAVIEPNLQTKRGQRTSYEDQPLATETDKPDVSWPDDTAAAHDSSSGSGITSAADDSFREAPEAESSAEETANRISVELEHESIDGTSTASSLHEQPDRHSGFDEVDVPVSLAEPAAATTKHDGSELDHEDKPCDPKLRPAAAQSAHGVDVADKRHSVVKGNLEHYGVS